MIKNIFDTNDYTGLPKSYIPKKAKSSFYDELVKIFEEAEQQGISELNAREIWYAHYRMFKKEQKIENVINKLFAAAKRGKIEKVGRGLYKLKK